MKSAVRKSPPTADDDTWVTTALATPHRLPEPLRAVQASAVP